MFIFDMRKRAIGQQGCYVRTTTSERVLRTEEFGAKRERSYYIQNNNEKKTCDNAKNVSRFIAGINT